MLIVPVVVWWVQVVGVQLTPPVIFSSQATSRVSQGLCVSARICKVRFDFEGFFTFPLFFFTRFEKSFL